jgi:predicted membrane channel-forming protein YqfA (hemolysin III family)
MQADTLSTTPGPGDRGITFTRIVLVLPLALGIYGQLSGLAWLPRTPGQDTLFYVVGAAVDLVPLLLYAFAAFLVLTARRPLAGWTLLFVGGVVLSALAAYYFWQYREGGVLLFVPPYLAALALVELLRGRGAERSASG